jgi:integrase
LILGVPERAVIGLMGWSTTAMAARYQHVTAPVFEGVAAQVGELLWGAVEEPIETKTETEASSTGDGT